MDLLKMIGIETILMRRCFPLPDRTCNLDGTVAHMDLLQYRSVPFWRICPNHIFRICRGRCAFSAHPCRGNVCWPLCNCCRASRSSSSCSLPLLAIAHDQFQWACRKLPTIYNRAFPSERKQNAVYPIVGGADRSHLPCGRKTPQPHCCSTSCGHTHSARLKVKRTKAILEKPIPTSVIVGQLS
ncbi:putative keratin-associated protein 10-8 [Trichinella spiralis]|uniref:putative keratin-associated protein 10-8 n=1 Tax=Trichinella spiralis TaxID=6334 RepID=UPI0001EFD53F|nr:putative keratin-associated protein 10-8 [Trichinella spiralis]